MKSVYKLNKNTRLSQIVYWGKLLTVTGAAQVIVQAVGLISGIIIVRCLSTQEYAFYTIANTMLGMMTVLADGGIGAGVMAEGGKVWQDKTKLGVVLVTGLNLRKKFAILSLLISIPILFYLLAHHGASLLKSISIIACLIPAFTAALSDSLLEISLKLKQDIKTLQKNQVFVAVFRFIINSFTYIYPVSAVAIIASGVPRILGNYKLRKVVIHDANLNQKPDINVQRKIVFVVKRILPGAFYYCISGQITVWLVSIFGSTKALAQIGALTRLTMILSLFSTVFTTLIIPRFSRLTNNKKVLLKYFVLILLALLGLSFLIVFTTWLFPSQILWILGKSYSKLDLQLLLSVIVSCLSLLAGSCFGIITSRGWAINPLISIPVNIVGIIIGVSLINISTITGVLYFNIFDVSIHVLMYVLYAVFKLLTLE